MQQTFVMLIEISMVHKVHIMKFFESQTKFRRLFETLLSYQPKNLDDSVLYVLISRYSITVTVKLECAK